MSKHGPRPIPPEQRFWKFVCKSDTPEGCWLWTGTLSTAGYGRLRFSNPRRMVKAHRFSYELAYGPISDDALVCHRCDTPACVNPAHLFLGTHADNAQDKSAKGRCNTPDRTGAHNGRAILTEDQVRSIRALQSTGAHRRELAQMFGVSPSAIKKIVARYTWRHL